jgi:hypothetical protein
MPPSNPDPPSDDPPDPAKEQKRKNAYSVLEASSIGWMFPIAIALGYLWGWAMDVYLFHTTWLRYLFAGFGIIAAFLNLFRIALAGGKSDPPA